jgi:hypothetical protein
MPPAKGLHQAVVEKRVKSRVKKKQMKQIEANDKAKSNVVVLSTRDGQLQVWAGQGAPFWAYRKKARMLQLVQGGCGDGRSRLSQVHMRMLHIAIVCLAKRKEGQMLQSLQDRIDDKCS